MNLYSLSALILVYAAVLTVMVFLSYKNRLASINDETPLSVEVVNSIFESSQLERTLGYALVAALAYLIWQIIQQGFDFALLMIGATTYTGIVFLVDRFLTKQRRLAIIERAESDIADFDDKTDKSTLEPGLIENSRAFFPILVFVFILRSFLIEPFQIPSGSMRPTLEIRDFILVNRFTFGVRVPISNKVLIPVSKPEQGDVIVFKPPHEPDKNYIKRVIAVAGDKVYYDETRRTLYVNGKPVKREYLNTESDDERSYRKYTETLGERSHLMYINQAAISFGENWIPKGGVVVPEGKYFVMGDNRDNSLDARYWELLRQSRYSGNGEDWRFVDEDAILGEAFFIWMHWEGFYPSFSRAGKIN